MIYTPARLFVPWQTMGRAGGKSQPSTCRGWLFCSYGFRVFSVGVRIRDLEPLLFLNGWVV